MTRLTIQRWMRRAAAVSIAALLPWGPVSGARAAVTDTAPDAWGEDEVTGGPEITYAADGSASVRFAAQSTGSPPQYRAALLMANAAVSGGAFVGDYVAEGIKAIHVRVSNSQPACWVELVLQGAESGRLWRNRNLLLSDGSGWVTNTISMDRSAGWVRDDEGNLDTMWTQDLQNVAMVGVRLIQSGFGEQTCAVDQFMLKDSAGFVTAAAELTDLQQALLDRFGVSSVEALTGEQSAADADQDGMSDVQELMAGTNPDSASSVFTAEVVEDSIPGDTGVTISWPCVVGARYTVLRATDLMSGFQNLAVGLVATETGVMTYHDATATGEGTYFYRIRKD